MGANISEISDSNFQSEVLSANTPVLVDFWATWCGPCRALAPTIETLAKDYDGKVKFCKVDVDENPNNAAEFGVRSIPTLILFKDGKIPDMDIDLLVDTLILRRTPNRGLDDDRIPNPELTFDSGMYKYALGGQDERRFKTYLIKPESVRPWKPVKAEPGTTLRGVTIIGESFQSRIPFGVEVDVREISPFSYLSGDREIIAERVSGETRIKDGTGHVSVYRDNLIVNSGKAGWAEENPAYILSAGFQVHHKRN